MIHSDLSPRLHHSSLAVAALAAVAAEGQTPTSVSMPQSSFPQKTPFAIQELLGLTNDVSDSSNDLKNHQGHGTNNGHLDACSGGFSAAAAAAAMVSSVSSYNNRSFMSQAAHQAFSAAVSGGNDQYNNRMYFNTGLFGNLQSPGGFASAAAAVAAQSMHSPGGAGGGGSSGMSHHLFDAASFRNEHGFPG